MYQVYRIGSKMYYNGISLVAADNADEANSFIEDFKKTDKGNLMDSLGYESVHEDDVMNDIFSGRKGIIYYGIYYS